MLRFAFAILLVVDCTTAWAAPKAALLERWLANDPGGPAAIDHAPWDRFLGAYVHPDGAGVNRVAYARVSARDRQALAAYLARLSRVPISGYRRAAQLAFWINLYNALTVKLVLDHYPVDSIRDIDISPGFFSIGPWGKTLVEVEGIALSLDDIEHRIVRPIWRDPRVHYALDCAAIGCPDLIGEAFTAEKVDAQLTAAARDYVNDRRGVRFEGGRLVISKLYNWYAADFGGDETGVLAHLREYASPALRARLDEARRIDGTAYDWSLNDVP